MRLKSLYVKNFRSIDGEVKISLDAPIVLIHGPNGAGKTSLLSAIELALTGSVPSLSRAEPDYLAFLPHKDRPFGEVRLEVATDDGTLKASTLRVTTGAVSGSPLLTNTDASFFSERSYLAQSTLGRLLEIYQHADKKSDSPLTRFVKELLGLDRMEALIGGLYTAGNIARLKGPAPLYGEIRERISRDDAEVLASRNKANEIEAAIEAQEKELRQRIAFVGPSSLDIDSADLIQSLTGTSEEPDLTILVRARRELEVSQAAWTSGTLPGPNGSDQRAIEAANQRARSAFELWKVGPGQAVEPLLGRAGSLFADVSVSRESNFVERARVLRLRIVNDLERVDRVLAAHEASLLLRDELARRLEESRTRLDRVDREISAASAANDAYARMLSDLMTHVDGDICPVCDRDFTEVSDTPLSAHIAAKVATMVEQVGRLQSLVQSRTSTQAEVARLDREKQAAVSSLVSETELTDLKTRAADLAEVDRRLEEVKSQLEEGDRLRDEASRSAQALVALHSADQSSIVLRNNVENLARQMNIPFDTATTTEWLLQELAKTIDQRSQMLSERQTSRRSAIEAANALIALRDSRDQFNLNFGVLKDELSKRMLQKAEADKTIDLGREVARQAREARSRVVRRVFNDELNAVWRELFIRLAPEEPFIPAFAIPETVNSDVEAVLETHHRRGGKGGNPRAMLSAGNLNTAALTLFLALHLSVKSNLPWLVIDDPVQSMDEVHIAQFAALLRTLSKQMGRQVIVAVHERALFDYLALELSPAFEGDRLNVVELGRNASGQTTCRWDARQFIEDRAIAV